MSPAASGSAAATIVILLSPVPDTPSVPIPIGPKQPSLITIAGTATSLYFPITIARSTLDEITSNAAAVAPPGAGAARARAGPARPPRARPAVAGPAFTRALVRRGRAAATGRHGQGQQQHHWSRGPADRSRRHGKSSLVGEARDGADL